MKKYLVLALATLAGLGQARAEVRLLGKVYAQEGPRTEPVFDFKNELVKTDEKHVSTSTFVRGDDGRIAAVEVTTFDPSGRLKSYSLEEKQQDFKGVLEVVDGKAKFSFTKDGKTKTNEEKAGDDLIVGSMIPEDLQANWEKITKGAKLKRRLAVVDRLETIGFEFSKESDAEVMGQKVAVIMMRPSNFLIAALVKPLRFFVKADGSALVELHGRTLIKRQVGSKFEDLDAVTVYTQLAGGNSK